ncbi:hypothetical protein HERIO_1054 [Hepatospora eriocheir]|uniref:Uncharacterized protein n=1 Tax=Hepatospora eriocheir TaxID=1081669 RepID=A0A1X0QB85_9MICR|nr:hypothetical protein HERIO_1054 [Hepatospora eriocheir]
MFISDLCFCLNGKKKETKAFLIGKNQYKKVFLKDFFDIEVNNFDDFQTIPADINGNKITLLMHSDTVTDENLRNIQLEHCSHLIFLTDEDVEQFYKKPTILFLMRGVSHQRNREHYTVINYENNLDDIKTTFKKIIFNK